MVDSKLAWGGQPEKPRGMDPKDHKVWVEFWGNKLVRAIADAIANPPADGQEDFRLRWVINCARLTHSRAVKAHPRLKRGASKL